MASESGTMLEPKTRTAILRLGEKWGQRWGPWGLEGQAQDCKVTDCPGRDRPSSLNLIHTQGDWGPGANLLRPPH